MKDLPVPRPRAPGIFALALAAASLIAARNGEFVLLLTGSLLSAVLLYSGLATTALALASRKKAAALNASLTIPALAAPSPSALRLLEPARFARLPACAIRYQLNLRASSGRTLTPLFPPSLFAGETHPFLAAERGAFTGRNDWLVIFDCFGFWQARLPVPRESGVRLRAAPRLKDTPPTVQSLGGADDTSAARGVLKTAEPFDSRPYVPGDDPRRLNWKLYAHAAQLFVRENAQTTRREKRLTLILDPEADPALFTQKEALAALDALCSAARALAEDCRARGITARLRLARDAGDAPDTDGGQEAAGEERGAGGLSAYALALAHPVPLLPGTARLSTQDAAEAALYLALPRLPGAKAAAPLLDRFLAQRHAAREAPAEGADILFVFNAERKDGPAERAALANALYYGRGDDVRARYAGL